MENYIVVTWPESQSLMDYDWFEDECELINTKKGIDKYGSAAYYVPIDRYNEIKNQDNALHVRIENKSNKSYINVILNDEIDVTGYSIRLNDKERLIKKDKKAPSRNREIIVAIDSNAKYLYKEDNCEITLYTNSVKAVNLIDVFKSMNSFIGAYNLMQTFLEN